MHMFSGGGHHMGGMHYFWWIFWVFLVGVLAFYGWGRSNNRQPSSRETPHAVLQRRLADGELTPEEYEQRKALLDRDGARS